MFSINILYSECENYTRDEYQQCTVTICVIIILSLTCNEVENEWYHAKEHLHTVVHTTYNTQSERGGGREWAFVILTG